MLLEIYADKVQVTNGYFKISFYSNTVDIEP